MKFSWRSSPAMCEMKNIFNIQASQNVDESMALKFIVLQTFWHQITSALPTRVITLRSLTVWLLTADKERKRLVCQTALWMRGFQHASTSQEYFGEYDTYHCVQTLKSIPVRALQQRIAVLISTDGSFSGSGPSRVGDQCPPIAMASSLPFIPTKN